MNAWKTMTHFTTTITSSSSSSSSSSSQKFTLEEAMTAQRESSSAVPLFLEHGARYPSHSRLAGSQCRSRRERKTSPPAGFDPRTVQPVASHYNDYTILRPPSTTTAFIFVSEVKSTVSVSPTSTTTLVHPSYYWLGITWNPFPRSKGVGAWS